MGGDPFLQADLVLEPNYCFLPSGRHLKWGYGGRQEQKRPLLIGHWWTNIYNQEGRLVALRAIGRRGERGSLYYCGQAHIQIHRILQSEGLSLE